MFNLQKLRLAKPNPPNLPRGNTCNNKTTAEYWILHHHFAGHETKLGTEQLVFGCKLLRSQGSRWFGWVPEKFKLLTKNRMEHIIKSNFNQFHWPFFCCTLRGWPSFVPPPPFSHGQLWCARQSCLCLRGRSRDCLFCVYETLLRPCHFKITFGLQIWLTKFFFGVI